jgi:tetratricopeptide (TPR) repeat protein
MRWLFVWMWCAAPVTFFAQPGDRPDYALNARINELTKAIEADPACARCHCELAALSPTEENLFRAMLYDSLCHGSTSLLMAKRAFQRGSAEDAWYYLGLSKSYGNYSEELYSYALSVAQEKDDDLYTRWLDEALSRFPRNPWFLNRRADQYYLGNDYYRADSTFRFAVNQLAYFPEVEARHFIGNWIDRIAATHIADAKIWATTLMHSTQGANDRFWTAQRIGRWYDLAWNEPDSAIAYYSLAIDIASEHKGSGPEMINGLSNEAAMRRGVCYLKTGNVPAAEADWLHAVMFEYDEHSDIETTLNELSSAYPDSDLIRAMQWMLRQNQEYRNGPKKGAWLTNNINRYRKVAEKSEYGYIIILCGARAYVWDGQCRKAKRTFQRVPNRTKTTFLYQDVKRLINRCEKKGKADN